MTVIQKTIGRLPVNLGDYDSTRAYGKKNRVLLYGCEWESKVNNNTYAPAALNTTTGVITPDTTHWKLISGSYNTWLIDNGYQKMAASNVKDGNNTQHEINNAVTNEIGTDSTPSSIKGRVTNLETAVGTGGSVDSRISAAVATETTRAQTAESNLQELYEGLTQSNMEVVDTLPATGEAYKIYRLIGTNSYADYMYNSSDLTTPIKMAEYDNAIDDVPTAGSNNLVKSGGIYKNIKGIQDYNSIYKSSANEGLDIADDKGNVIVRLEKGHITTKNFKSSRTSSVATQEADVDFDVVDEAGNVLVRFENGQIATKGFSTKKKIKVLFIGNSICQDHVTYLPWLFRQIYGNEIDFTVGIFYIGASTLKQYVEDVITGHTNAVFWSVADNTESWTTVHNIPLIDALKSYNWDVITMQAHFLAPEEGNTEDITLMPTFVRYLQENANVPFEFAFIMEQIYNVPAAWEREMTGTEYIIKNNPVSILFPCGFATEYAKSYFTTAQLTPDGTHANEGMPCLLGCYTVLNNIAEHYGWKISILGSKLKMTSAIQQTLNIPGANGQVDDSMTDEDYYNAQICSIKAVNAGKGYFSKSTISMANDLD